MLLKNNLSIFFGIFLVSMILVPNVSAQEVTIPDWIKNNAGWWADGLIDDNSFVSGIQWLISNGIMIISPTEQGANDGGNVIPDWIKNNAGWWADGQIKDQTFVTGIQYLVKNGIILIDEDNNLEKKLLETRKNIIKSLWKNEQLPLHVPQQIETNIEDETFSKLGHIKQIDRFTVNMKHDVNSVIFLIHPENQFHDELIIYHNGHIGKIHNIEDSYEGKNTVRFFLERGYPVLVVSLPLHGVNNRPTVIVDEEPILLEDHPNFKSTKNEEFNPLSYFFEPIAVTLNFLDKEHEFKKYHMMGLSGGGWASIIYAAIDERISTTFSVAGGVPIDHFKQTERGHWEFEEFPSIASYYDLYVLDTLGERKFIQIFNSHDPCCWGEGQDFGFKKLVQEKVSKLENSYYDLIVVDNFYHKFNPAIMWTIFTELDDENLEYFNNIELRKSNNDFSLTGIGNMSMNGDDLRHADFSGLTIWASDFSNFDLSYSTFYYNTLSNTDFSNSDLSFADFSYSVIKEAVFENTILRGADFQFSKLENIDFRNSSLEDVNFKQAWCINCNFDGINFTDSIKAPDHKSYTNFPSFPGSSFRDVDFRVGMIKVKLILH